MSSRILRCSLFLLLLFSFSASWALGQTRAASDVAYAAQLRPLVRASGMIFSGRVSSVRLIPAAQDGAVATVEVRFNVEHGFRGVRSGRKLRIREWAGLWTGGPRYRVGERVMLFFYPPSRAGLTSPVGGALGRFAVDDTGRIVVGPPGRTLFKLPPHEVGPHVKAAGATSVSYREFARAIREVAGEE